VQMIDSIVLDKKRVLPVSVLLKGEYGIDGLFVGVPIKLSRKGVEQIIELKWTGEELVALKQSSNTVKDLVAAMAAIRAAI